MSDIHIINGKAKPNITKEALRKLQEEFPLFVEHMKMMAKLQRAKFEALKENGFTESQALELCKNIS